MLQWKWLLQVQDLPELIHLFDKPADEFWGCGETYVVAFLLSQLTEAYGLDSLPYFVKPDLLFKIFRV
jgi:hypothetical protein